jgi:hypothetical protein
MGGAREWEALEPVQPLSSQEGPVWFPVGASLWAPKLGYNCQLCFNHVLAKPAVLEFSQALQSTGDVAAGSPSSLPAKRTQRRIQRAEVVLPHFYDGHICTTSTRLRMNSAPIVDETSTLEETSNREIKNFNSVVDGPGL